MLDVYIKFGIKLFHLTLKEKGKSTIGHKKSEKKR